jgi:hypothetical protein
MVTKDIIKLVLEKYGVLNIDKVLSYFGIFTSRNGSSIDGALNADDSIVNVIKEWPEESGSKLLFMIRLFMPSLWGLQHKDVVAKRLKVTKSALTLQNYILNAEEIDPQLTHLQYLQAVYSIITGQYPTTTDEALELGCLHFFFKFGEYQDSRHRIGFLGPRIVEFIPVKLLKQKSIEEWEQIFLNFVKEYSAKSGFSSDTPDDKRPQREYMKIVFSLSHFGFSYFKTSQKSTKLFPDKVVIGINHQGLQ